MSVQKIYLRYLAVVVAFTVIMLLLVLVVNLYFDPLWYGTGNKRDQQNYAFNERIAKSNLLLQDKEAYDCIILGSSRVTLLDQNLIKGHRCFNYSFSAATVEDLIAFGAYVKAMGVILKLVVIGVDGENFTAGKFNRIITNNKKLPTFVREQTLPPPNWQSYLTADALRFSVRTFFHDTPLPRYYDENFTVRVVVDAPIYDPVQDKIKKLGPYNREGVVHYKTLVDLFPEAKVVGYVPPVSIWWIEKMATEKTLAGYVQAIHSVAQIFPTFYDFSVPSLITQDVTMTYDGGHYFSTVQEKIAESLNEGSARFGLRIDGMSLSSYQAQFMSQHKKYGTSEVRLGRATDDTM